MFTGKQCPPNYAHNDIRVRKIGSSGYFLMEIFSEQSSLFLSPALQPNVFYQKKKLDNLPHSFHLEDIWIPTNSVTVAVATYDTLDPEGIGFMHFGLIFTSHQVITN